MSDQLHHNLTQLFSTNARFAQQFIQAAQEFIQQDQPRSNQDIAGSFTGFTGNVPENAQFNQLRTNSAPVVTGTAGPVEGTRSNIGSGISPQRSIPYPATSVRDVNGQTFSVFRGPQTGFPNHARTSSAPDRDIRNRTRNRLFGRGISGVENRDRSFEKSIIVMDQTDHGNPKGPNKAEERFLLSKGLGKKVLTFYETDDPPMVAKRIKDSFPVLSFLTGGIKMWITGSGNCLKLYSLASPVVSGSILKNSGNRIFVTPLRQEEMLPDVVLMTGILASCIFCQEEMDISLLNKHESSCDVRRPTTTSMTTMPPSTSSQQIGNPSTVLSSPMVQQNLQISAPAPVLGTAVNSAALSVRAATQPLHTEQINTLIPSDLDLSLIDDDAELNMEEAKRLLKEHKRSVMHLLDSEATNDIDFTNTLSINRNNYLEECIEAALSTTFTSKIGFPLKVKFVDEDGIDYGGLRRELMSLMFDSIRSTLESVNHSYSQIKSGAVSEQEIMSLKDIEDRLYAFGVWSGVGVMQCDFTDPFISKWIKVLENEHPFIIGLNLLEIPKFLKDNPVAHLLFKNVQVSLQIFKDGQIVNRTYHPVTETEERLRKMAEIRALSHFFKFLEGIESGNIKERDHRGNILTLTDVYHFITGSRFGPSHSSNSVLTYSFVLNTPGVKLLPTSSTCNCSVMLPLTTSKKDMEEIWIRALQDGSHSFNRI